MGCQHTQYTFEPKIPTVYLVVDRSGSMFHCLSATPRHVCANKAGHVVVHAEGRHRDRCITQLDAQVRFGFTTIFGTDPSTGGGMCPLMHRHARRQRRRRR